jgi:hypothetical protein
VEAELLPNGVGVVTFVPVLFRGAGVVTICFGGGPGLSVKQTRENKK